MYTNPNPNVTPQCRARKYGQTDGRTDDQGYNIIRPFGRIKKKQTRFVCETVMSPKHPSFEKHDPDI